MLQSLMVYPNDNDFLHMASILDDNVNTDHHHNHHNHHQIESYMTTSSTSASSSPIQDYLMAPTYQHPQQQHPNQRQHQLQFPIVPVMPSMVAAAAAATAAAAAASHSTPPSPSYSIIKTEEVQTQQRMDYLMFPANFDLPSSTTTTATSVSSTSPQMQQQRMTPYDASFIQQRQHHQQQQQQHAQQLRLQHQRVLEQQQQQQQQQHQHQMVFDAPTHSTASTMSIPTTNTMMSTMPAANAPTTTPFFHPSNIAYMPAAHPAAPKRKREESGQSLPRQTSPQLLDNTTTTVMTTPSVSSDEPSRSTSPSLVTLPKKISSPSSRPSTSSRLDKVKATRSTKVTKFASSPTLSSSSIASTSSALFPSATDMLVSTTSSAQDSKATRASAKKSTPKKAQSESRETSPIAATDSASSASPATANGINGTGNITHPRRAAQNRAAQRTFRNRRKAYIKELEQKVEEMDQTRNLMDAIQRENQEVWRRLQVLEAMASQNGLQVPAFPALTPFSTHLINDTNTANVNGMMMMTSHSSNPMMGSSNEEDEDEDEDMSDSYAHPAYPLLHQRQHPHHQQL
ncbi:hypothetical protein BGZ96_008110 [Linnemannia gamsii]|uniref:BZIP domain-containing protein n=1 Tax=Linnemannia gamsii TaxID=64522 RepID=A0ABQ7JZZ2_9FUNG|nr:hypothetical protein BGZ96_008110 [Linnemannia gamsii]